MKLFSPSLCGAQEATVQCDPRMICHFSLACLASWHGDYVCPLRSSRWLRTSLLQMINVLRKFVWNGILVDNLSLCHPQRNQPWLWLPGELTGSCKELSISAFRSAKCLLKIILEIQWNASSFHTGHKPAFKSQWFSVTAACWLYLNQWTTGKRLQKCDYQSPETFGSSRISYWKYLFVFQKLGQREMN